MNAVCKKCGGKGFQEVPLANGAGIWFRSCPNCLGEVKQTRHRIEDHPLLIFAGGIIGIAFLIFWGFMEFSKTQQTQRDREESYQRLQRALQEIEESKRLDDKSLDPAKKLFSKPPSMWPQQEKKEVVNCVAFSPDGKVLASGGYVSSGIPFSDYAAIWLHDSATGKLKSKLQLAQRYGVRSVAFSPDGTMLASGDDEGIKLWEVATGMQKAAWGKGHQYSFIALTFSPDGKTLAVSGGNQVKLWNVASGMSSTILQLDAGHDAFSVAFSPDGASLAFGIGEDSGVIFVPGNIKVWDLASGKVKATFQKLDANSLAFSPDGKTLASLVVSSDFQRSQIKIWDVGTGMEKQTFELGRDDIDGPVRRSLAFSPDGKRLASVTFSGEIKLWDVTTGKNTTTLATNGTAVAFGPDGETLAVAGNGIGLWDLASGKQVNK